MKTLSLFFLLLVTPLAFYAQHSLSGLWTGTTSNDSVTVRKDQGFEIALTQYKQKVSGYSRTEFIVNDTLYYIVKRVKGTIEGDICEIKDDEIIAFNFPGKLDKKVKVTTQFRMNRLDSTWQLMGNWSTNQVKNKYYSITGKVELKEEKNLDRSKIFPHLEELNLANDVAFYVASKTTAAATNTNTLAAVPPPVKKQQETVSKPVSTTTQKPTTTIPPPVVKKTEPVAITDNKAKDTIAKTIAAPPVKKPDVGAALLAERKMAPPQIVNFQSDSIQLSLYDNGEIDGDTVSVLLNGELILSKQVLKASAVKKTIRIKPGTDEVTLILYAENLGRYPPNTGLLVVHDGDNIYQVRFSADLQQNAAIIFRRKK